MPAVFLVQRPCEQPRDRYRPPHAPLDPLVVYTHHQGSREPDVNHDFGVGRGIGGAHGEQR